MSLEALGWNARWQEKLEAHGGEGLVPARVVGEHRSHYRIATEVTELSAGTTGRMRNTAGQRSDLPGVGDFVAADLSERDSPATIEVVLPRTSALIRKASGTPDPQLLAANIDVVFIVTSMGGDFNLPRMKRYCALVQQSGAAPVIVVNKSDLVNNSVSVAGGIAQWASNMTMPSGPSRLRVSSTILTILWRLCLSMITKKRARSAAISESAVSLAARAVVLVAPARLTVNTPRMIVKIAMNTVDIATTSSL